MNNLKKKIVAMIIGLSMVAVMAPGLAQALTADELQTQITALLAQLAALQTQLTTLQGAAPAAGVTGCTITSFDRNLKQGMTGDDVKCLQIALNSDSATQVAATGVGSSGNETTYFGAKTAAAVKKFQEKYASDILASYGLTAGTGFVGSTTRAKLNTILGGVTPGCDCTAWVSGNCAAGTCLTTQKQQTRTCTPATGAAATACAAVATTQCVVDATCSAAAGLTVTLNPATPASSSVPRNGADVIFTTVNLSAGGTDVTISKIILTRSGLSVDADLNWVKLYVGTAQQGTSQILSNNKATFVLTTPITVKAGTTTTLKLAGDIAALATVGGRIALGIASASDITAAVTPGGVYPVVGLEMVVVNIGLGGLTVATGSLNPPTNVGVDAGKADFRFLQIRLGAGPIENVNVNQITAVMSGNAGTGDIENIELYNDTEGKSVATLAALDASGRAVFNLTTPIAITRGTFKDLSIIADVIKGSTRIVEFDVNDGIAYTIMATGATYGYGIIPANGAAWNTVAGTFGVGQPITINTGTLSVTRGTATPATGNIGIGAQEVPFTIFDFTVLGEEIQITRVVMTINCTASVATDLTNIVIVDSAGNVVAGPVNGAITNAPGAGDGTATFTTTFTSPIGVNKYTVKANVAQTVLNAQTFQLGFDAAGGGAPFVAVTGRGATSGRWIVVAPAVGTVYGNIMTAQAATLRVTNATTPAIGTVVVNQPDKVLAHINLDATGSGEDVRITNMVIDDTVGGGGAIADVKNIEVWPANGTAKYSNSTTVYTPAALVAGVSSNNFTFSTPIIVPKGKILTVWVVADGNANIVANGAGTHTVDIDGATSTVTAFGSDTGTQIVGGALIYTGAGGQAQTTWNGGRLAVGVEAGSPAAAQVIADTDGTEIGRFEFIADREAFNVTNLVLTRPAGADSDFEEVYLYESNGSTLIKSVDISGGVATFALTSSPIAVAQDGTPKVVVVKADWNSTTTGVTSGDAPRIGIANVAGVTASGASSGVAPVGGILSVGWGAFGAAKNAAVMTLYQTSLVAAKSGNSPSGSHTSSVSDSVAIFNFAANAKGLARLNSVDISVSGTAMPAIAVGADSDVGAAIATAGTLDVVMAAAPAYTVGDRIYFDADDDDFVSAGDIRLVAVGAALPAGSIVVAADADFGNATTDSTANGANDVGFVDNLIADGIYEPGESVYADVANGLGAAVAAADSRIAATRAILWNASQSVAEAFGCFSTQGQRLRLTLAAPRQIAANSTQIFSILINSVTPNFQTPTRTFVVNLESWNWSDNAVPPSLGIVPVTPVIPVYGSTLTY